MNMVKSKPRRPQQALALATAILTTAMVAANGAQSEAAEAKAGPRVMIFDPMDTPPMKRPGDAYIENGMTQHRRVISKAKQGSRNIDIAYNSYKAGAGSEEPYAYNKDEVCYFASGEAWWRSDGDEVITRPGYFMWRPARAATHNARALTNAVTICAFGPARDDEWSHRLTQEEISKRDKDPNKPKAIFRHYRDIMPTSLSGEAADGPIVVRHVFSKPRDGAAYVDVSHVTYKAGLKAGRYAYSHDEVCWLESGEIEMVNGGAKETLKAGQIMYRPAGAVTDQARVTADAVAICFFAPAREKDLRQLLP